MQVLLFLPLLLCTFTVSQVLYVTQAPEPSTPNCGTELNPCNNIGDAASKINGTNYNEIRLSPGTYTTPSNCYLTLVLSGSLHLSGREAKISCESGQYRLTGGSLLVTIGEFLGSIATTTTFVTFRGVTFPGTGSSNSLETRVGWTADNCIFTGKFKSPFCQIPLVASSNEIQITIQNSVFEAILPSHSFIDVIGNLTLLNVSFSDVEFVKYIFKIRDSDSVQIDSVSFTDTRSSAFLSLKDSDQIDISNLEIDSSQFFTFVMDGVVSTIDSLRNVTIENSTFEYSAFVSCIDHGENIIYKGNKGSFQTVANRCRSQFYNSWFTGTPELSELEGAILNGYEFTIVSCNFTSNQAPSIKLFNGNITSSLFQDNEETSITSLAESFVAGYIAVIDCKFIENSAFEGVAIKSSAGLPKLIISNCYFEHNYGTGGTGALLLAASTVEIDRSSFVGNSAHFGGAIAILSTVIHSEISNCYFYGNELKTGGTSAFASAGGALYVAQNTPVTLRNCTFALFHQESQRTADTIYFTPERESSWDPVWTRHMTSSKSNPDYLIVYREIINDQTRMQLDFHTEDSKRAKIFADFYDKYWVTSVTVHSIDLTAQSLVIVQRTPQTGVCVLWTINFLDGAIEDLTFYDQPDVGLLVAHKGPAMAFLSAPNRISFWPNSFSPEFRGVGLITEQYDIRSLEMDQFVVSVGCQKGTVIASSFDYSGNVIKRWRIEAECTAESQLSVFVLETTIVVGIPQSNQVYLIRSENPDAPLQQIFPPVAVGPEAGFGSHVELVYFSRIEHMALSVSLYGQVIYFAGPDFVTTRYSIPNRFLYLDYHAPRFGENAIQLISIHDAEDLVNDTSYRSSSAFRFGQDNPRVLFTCTSPEGQLFAWGKALEDEIDNCNQATFVPCPEGTYKTNISLVCDLCPSGTYSSSGAVECTPCPDGAYCPPGSPRPISNETLASWSEQNWRANEFEKTDNSEGFEEIMLLYLFSVEGWDFHQVRAIPIFVYLLIATLLLCLAAYFLSFRTGLGRLYVAFAKNVNEEYALEREVLILEKEVHHIREVLLELKPESLRKRHPLVHFQHEESQKRLKSMPKRVRAIHELALSEVSSDEQSESVSLTDEEHEGSQKETIKQRIQRKKMNFAEVLRRLRVSICVWFTLWSIIGSIIFITSYDPHAHAGHDNPLLNLLKDSSIHLNLQNGESLREMFTEFEGHAMTIDIHHLGMPKDPVRFSSEKDEICQAAADTTTVLKGCLISACWMSVSYSSSEGVCSTQVRINPSEFSSAFTIEIGYPLTWVPMAINFKVKRTRGNFSFDLKEGEYHGTVTAGHDDFSETIYLLQGGESIIYGKIERDWIITNVLDIVQQKASSIMEKKMTYTLTQEVQSSQYILQTNVNQTAFLFPSVENLGLSIQLNIQENNIWIENVTQKRVQDGVAILLVALVVVALNHIIEFILLVINLIFASLSALVIPIRRYFRKPQTVLYKPVSRSGSGRHVTRMTVQSDDETTDYDLSMDHSSDTSKVELSDVTAIDSIN